MKNIPIAIMVFLVAMGGVFAATPTLSVTNLKFTQQTYTAQYSSTGFSNTGTLSFDFKNTGSTTESGLLELAFFPAGNYALVSNTKTCNPTVPYNVHKTYTLNGGESVKIQIVSTDIPDGTYRVVLTHATSCCTNGVNSLSCAAKEPYGFEYAVATATFGSGAANAADQCDTDYQALQYLKTAEGVMNCKTAVCSSPTSASSTASCSAYGSCNSNAKQSMTCADGTTLDVRQCVNAEWQDLGRTCPDGAALPPVPGDTSNLLNTTNVVIGALALIGLYMFFGRKK